MVDPTAAALATAAPETMEINTLTATTTYESPPRGGPINASAKRVSRCVMPAAFMISPASRKKGSASKTSESAPTQIRCATTISEMSVQVAT